MKFCTDIHVSHRMNPNNFEDPLTFPLAIKSSLLCLLAKIKCGVFYQFNIWYVLYKGTVLGQQ